METFLLIIYWILLVISVFLIIFNVPGNFIIVGIYLISELIDKNFGIAWNIFFILLVIATILELLEFFLTAWSSKYFGASKQGTYGAIAGAIIGAIIGTGFMPVIGSFFGAFIGAFSGALIIEYNIEKNLDKAFTAGLGALIGFFSGKVAKIVGAVIMLIIIAIGNQ